MDYLKSKDLVKCLRDLKIRGGQGQLVAGKVLSLLGSISVAAKSPLDGLNVTATSLSQLSVPVAALSCEAL